MGKKDDKPGRVSTSGPSAGMQNPFGGLSSAGLPEASAKSTPAPEPKKPKREAVLRRETAHRGGKTVVVVGGIAPPMGTAALEDLAKYLRKACGCGGSVRNGEIEIQGEQAPKVRKLLESEGFRVRGV